MQSDAKPASAELQRFLAQYPSVRDLALALRDIVLAEIPNAVELAYQGYDAVIIGFRYSERPRSGICYILVQDGHVTLGFNRGAELPDPARLLDGTVRRARHLQVGSLTDLEQPHIRSFVRAAADNVARLAGTNSASEPAQPPRRRLR